MQKFSALQTSQLGILQLTHELLMLMKPAWQLVQIEASPAHPSARQLTSVQTKMQLLLVRVLPAWQLEQTLAEEQLAQLLTLQEMQTLLVLREKRVTQSEQMLDEEQMAQFATEQEMQAPETAVKLVWHSMQTLAVPQVKQLVTLSHCTQAPL